MALETVHDILCAIYLVPRVGLDTSTLIGWPIAAMIVFGVTLLTARRIGISETKALLMLGTLWALLTFVFEISIGLLQGMDFQFIANAVNPLKGGLLIYSLLVDFFSPWRAARLRGECQQRHLALLTWFIRPQQFPRRCYHAWRGSMGK